jgi:hypothetical protein
MFLLSFLLFLITDCLIRNDIESKLRKLWIKIIPISLVKIFQNWCKKVISKIYTLIEQKTNDSFKKIDFGFPTLEEFINLIPYNNWIYFFYFFVLTLLIWLLQVYFYFN